MPKKIYDYSLSMMTLFFSANIKQSCAGGNHIIMKEDCGIVVKDGYHLVILNVRYTQAEAEILQDREEHFWTSSHLHTHLTTC